MSFKDSMQGLIEKFSSSGDVKKLYGEPIEKNGKTLIPVASVTYGLGGGAGKKGNGEGDEGEGGGGGIMARPIGVVEITDEETRFIRFDQLSILIAIIVMSWTLKSIVKAVVKKL